MSKLGAFRISALTIGLVLALGACGGGGGNAAVSIHTLRAAVEDTEAAQSYRFTTDVKIKLLGNDVALHGSGLATGDGKQLQFTMDLGNSALQRLGARSFEIRVVDGDIYVDLGRLAGVLGGDASKHWLHISLDAIRSQLGANGSGLLDSSGSTPKRALEVLRSLSGDVENLGDDTVAGEHATHYRASIDYSKVIGRLPDLPDAVKQRLEKVGSVPADVWIDDHDRLVKLHLAIDGAAFGGSTTGTVETTMEMSDFGVDVHVEAPPADEVTDFSGLSDLLHAGSQSAATDA